MNRLLLPLVLVLLLVGCAHKPGAGSYADAATTGIALAKGGTELNPIIGWHPDPVVTVITALGVKQGAKYALEGLGHSHCQSDRLVESAGWAGAGYTSIVALASLASGYGIIVGVGAAILSYRWTPCTE